MRRTTRAIAGFPAGTAVIARVAGTPDDMPAGERRSLAQGLPSGAGLFDPATNVFKIRTDTYSGSLHAESAAIVTELNRQIGLGNGGIGVTMNTKQYNTPFYMVDEDTPLIEVKYKRWENPSSGAKPPLWDSFSAQVPWPWDAVPSLGKDRFCCLYKPSTGQYWEWWKARPRPGRPGSSDPTTNANYDPSIGGEVQASWGGYMENVHLNRGVFDDGASGHHYGGSATSIAYAGSAISVADVVSGEIDHAIAIQVIYAAPYSQRYWPAMRSDGGTPGNPIREGQRFRFPPDLDIASLPGLNNFSRMVMRAIQRYGCIVTDKAGAVALTGESGSAFKQADGTIVNPWVGGKFYPAGKFNYDVLKGIPWARLQAMPIDYGKPA